MLSKLTSKHIGAKLNSFGKADFSQVLKEASLQAEKPIGLGTETRPQTVKSTPFPIGSNANDRSR